MIGLYFARCRGYGLKKAYGLSDSDFDSMLALQGGVCAICGSSKSMGTRRLHVDHCHETGRVRGLLCGKCNLGIGYLKDSPEMVRKALSYLEAAT